MLSLLQPTYLLGLLGILIPLGIHLWSRKEGKVLQVGTIRWMQNSTASKLSRLRFHDWILFALRSSIIILVVLILAAIAWKRPVIPGKKVWGLIDPGIPLEDLGHDYLTDLERQGVEIRNLDYGFETIDIQDENAHHGPEILTTPPALNIWKVIEAASLETAPPDSILVITRGYQINFRGEKPAISIPINWMTIPDKDPHFFIHEARMLANDSIITKIVKSTGHYTQIYKYTAPSGSLVSKSATQLDSRLGLKMHGDTLQLKRDEELLDHKVVDFTDTLQVFIIYEDGFEYAANNWEAALRAVSIHQEIPLKILLHQANEDSINFPDNVDWLVDLREDPVDLKAVNPKKIFSPGDMKDSLNQKWLTKKKSGDSEIYSINPQFLFERSATRSLPEALVEVLKNNPDPVLSLNDKRTLEINQLRTLSDRTNPESGNSEPEYFTFLLEPYIWMLVMFLMVMERVLSGKTERA